MSAVWQRFSVAYKFAPQLGEAALGITPTVRPMRRRKHDEARQFLQAPIPSVSSVLRGYNHPRADSHRWRQGIPPS